jgi:hypothetical protein
METNSAAVNYVPYEFTACKGVSFSAAVCGSDDGVSNQFLSLWDDSGKH